VLDEIAENRPGASLDRIVAAVDLRSGETMDALKELAGMGCVKDGKITNVGLQALQPYKVQRAILLAAGKGTRLLPITLTTPKPMVEVKGKRIIDTLLDAILAVGIQEIYIVRGYLAEKFDALLDKYPMIQFIENPLYDVTNNISSAYAARDKLRNCYICEADLYVQNPKIIGKYEYRTNYIGFPVYETDDWAYRTRGDRITGIGRAGTDCVQMLGVSYWTDEAGKVLSRLLAKCFDSGHQQIFWDEVPYYDGYGELEIAVRACGSEDIIEIDSANDIVRVDHE
jgi:CTP:phosphocholine cytidylyltransferase-like protein